MSRLGRRAGSDAVRIAVLLLLVVLVLVGCQATGGSGADRDELEAWELPAEVAAFVRSERAIDLAVPELIGHYQSIDPRLPIIASVFVYPAPGITSIGSSDAVIDAAERLATEEEFAASMRALEASHEGETLVHEGVATIEAGGIVRSGLVATYALPEPFPGAGSALTSQLYIFRLGDWTVKYRVTYATDQEVEARARVDEFLDGLAWPSDGGS